jgi:hypothetical protein
MYSTPSNGGEERDGIKVWVKSEYLVFRSKTLFSMRSPSAVLLVG